MSSSVLPTSSPPRITWLDLVRVLACYLVIVSHSTDNFVQTPDGKVDPTAAWFVSGVRACVPLFVMISGALLLPMRGTAEAFFRRRFSRVLVPFLIWGVVLALLPIPGAEPNWAPTNVLEKMVKAGSLDRVVYNVVMLPLNFTNRNVHFWFLYVILGLYLFIPVISPWVKQATNRGLMAFLGVWAFTLFLPYIQHFPGSNLFPALQGECDWNSRGMTFYFGGYLGYLVLGHWLARLPELRASRALPLAAVMFAAGWVFTWKGFLWSVDHKVVDKDLEFFIENLSPNVALMTVAIFIACRAVKIPVKLEPIVRNAAVLSFGIFLIHYWTLLWVRDWMLVKLIPGLGPAPAILLLATTTFLISWILAQLVSLLPGRRWLLG